MTERVAPQEFQAPTTFPTNIDFTGGVTLETIILTRSFLKALYLLTVQEGCIVLFTRDGACVDPAEILEIEHVKTPSMFLGFFLEAPSCFRLRVLGVAPQ